MNFDAKQVQKWQQLAYDDIRKGIYFNALPIISEDRVDIGEIDESGNDFTYRWVKELLDMGNGFKLDIKAYHKSLTDIERLYFNAQTHRKNHSRNALAFGYPLFIDIAPASPTGYMVAPLFIWEVSLEPKTPGVWTLNRKRDHNLSYNHLLVNRLVEKYSLKDIEQRFRKLIYGRQLTRQSLSEFGNSLAVNLEISGNISSIATQACPTLDQLNLFDNFPIIRWSGTLGIFPLQKIDKKERFNTLNPKGVALKTVSARKHEFGILPSDPNQKNILVNLDKSDLMVVQGAKGTGKSYLITNLISNLLSNGQRCLILASNTNSLSSIQRNLMNLGLQRLSYIFKDPRVDKLTMINSIKGIPSFKGKSTVFDENEFNVILEKTKRQHQDLEQNHQLINQVAFGTDNWTETVGRFLSNNRQEGRELLNTQLNPKDFDFVFREQDRLSQNIARSESLFSSIGTINHPLTELNGAIFEAQSSEDLKTRIEANVNYFKQKSEQLLHRYITQTADYNETLKDNYFIHFEELKNEIKEVKEFILTESSKYGTEFSESSNTKLKMFGVFSKKIQTIRQSRNQLLQKYQQLISAYNQRQYFDYKFAEIPDGNVSLIKREVEDFEHTIEDWKNRIPSIVDIESNRLNIHTVHPHLDYKGRISDLEYQHDLLIDEINEAKLFDEWINNNNNTIAKRQKHIEKLAESLEHIELNLRDFDTFFPWQKNWLSLSEQERKIIRAIVKVKPKSWLSAFESWYFHHCLQNKYVHKTVDKNKRESNEFLSNYEQLRQQMSNQIQHHWSKHHSTVVDKLRKENHFAHQLIFSKNSYTLSKENTLSEIFSKSIAEISNFLPVMMMSSHAAGVLLPHLEGVFDYVIVEDGENIPTHDIIDLLDIGKHAIITGDSFAMTQIDGNILDFAQEQTPKTYPLSIHHQNLSNDIFLFKNEIFYNGQLRNRKLNSAKVASSFLELVGGEYDITTKTNRAEVDYILDLLAGLQANVDGAYPKIGIICLTTAQRDLFRTEVLSRKQNNAVLSKLLLNLQKSGLEILHIGEIESYAFDISYISLTFGGFEVDENDTVQINLLNQALNKNNTNLLLSSSKEDIYICSSLSRDFTEYFSQHNEHEGLYIISNLTKYLQAESFENKKYILERMKQRILPLSPPSDSIFVEEVIHYLQPYLEKNRLTNESVLDNTTKTSFMVYPLYDNQPTIVILCDGIQFEAKTGAYHWEKEIVRLAEEQAYKILHTNSYDWWKNPAQEARKLASQIIRIDNEFAPAVSEQSVE